MATDNVDKPVSRFREGVHALSGSLICALFLIFFDAVLWGSFVFAALVCPIWLIVSLFRAGLGTPSVWSPARVLAPIVTGVAIYANYLVQCKIAYAHGDRVVQACERYREANGEYPAKLADLVPEYLSSIPAAKYCLDGDFQYNASDGDAMLYWVEIPPFGCQIYNFKRKSWGYLD